MYRTQCLPYIFLGLLLGFSGSMMSMEKIVIVIATKDEREEWGLEPIELSDYKKMLNGEHIEKKADEQLDVGQDKKPILYEELKAISKHKREEYERFLFNAGQSVEDSEEEDLMLSAKSSEPLEVDITQKTTLLSDMKKISDEYRQEVLKKLLKSSAEEEPEKYKIPSVRAGSFWSKQNVVIGCIVAACVGWVGKSLYDYVQNKNNSKKGETSLNNLRFTSIGH